MAQTSRARAELAEQLFSLFAPMAEEKALEVLDVECTGDAIRVTLDDPSGPLDSALLDELTPVISAALDGVAEVDAAYPRSYLLEVSTPGIERLLRTRAHFRRFVGYKVAVKLKAEVDGERRLHGRIEAVDDNGVEVELDSGGKRSVTFDEVERARTVFEWPAQPKKSLGAKGSAKK